jgi:Zn-dependent metalloprotease
LCVLRVQQQACCNAVQVESRSPNSAAVLPQNQEDSQMTVPHSAARCLFVPPHVIEYLARASGMDTSTPGSAQRTAVLSQQLRDLRQAASQDPTSATPSSSERRTAKGERKIYDDQNTTDFDVKLVRREGEPDTSVTNVDQAYEHSGAARAYFKDQHGRNSIDDNGLIVNVNVNYDQDFNNAFWDGTRLVMGNGDGQIFVDFAASPDVAGHELTHGVVEFTANLVYKGQSGALNESFADVFGSLIEQNLRGQDFASANWLIGDEIMGPTLYGEALRSMAHPGTAYDNPLLGKDPQPDHMSAYYSGPKDNYGVHINSGIVNRAFYLTASELGTDNAGLIWYAGLQNLWPTAVFTDAAEVLSAQARILARDKKVDRQAAQVVRSAFRSVGVV